MKTYLLILLTIGCLFSCSKKKQEKSLIISSEFAHQWKLDSVGCAGVRQKILVMMPEKQKFIGVNLDTVISKLGYPNEKHIIGNCSIYFYCVDCGYAPIPKFSSAEKTKSNTGVNDHKPRLKYPMNGLVFAITVNKTGIVINAHAILVD